MTRPLGLSRLVGALLATALLGCDGANEPGDSVENPSDGSVGTGSEPETASPSSPTDSTDHEGSATDASPTDGPPADHLPKPTGPCPDFASGTLVFAPSALATQRKARVWIGSAAETADGPLIFYWYGTGSSTDEVNYGLGQTVINAVKKQGGMIVAPIADPAAGEYNWHLVASDKLDDLILMDEIVGCTLEQVGLDTRRIHSIGMSAGALHTAQASLRRSNYLASVVTYSGGISYGAPPIEDPTNKFAAMIFHGGNSDEYILDFKATSEAYDELLGQEGHFSFLCNHGTGHSIPFLVTGSAWRFFQDHPYGTNPSPYADGLPQSFPGYCKL